MILFIFGEVASSKNSKIPIVIKSGKKKGKNVIVSSSATSKYIRKTKKQWQIQIVNFRRMIEGKEKPYKIQFRFVRATKQKFDFINMAQILMDLMQKYGWIDDDDYTNVVPSFVPEVTIDKQNCGVEIKVL